MYINGEWEEADSQETIAIENPATKETIAYVPKGGTAETERAVTAADEALKSWKSKTAYERSAVLMNWYNLVNENKEDLARTMTKEQGKPLAEAIGEIDYANNYILWYAEEAKRIYGETIPASHQNKRLLVIKQPVGVVAAITPWNFPAAMITRKAAPALAAGCTIVVKPAKQTPLTAIKLAELGHKAGIPKGVLNVVTGDSGKIGDVLLNDTRVRKLTFTGSTEVGKTLMKQAANTMKKLSLELGGHAPFIIMGDADLRKAAQNLLGSKFRNAGQTCVCTNRVYVEETVEQDFIKVFKEEVDKIKVGNGLVEGHSMGPLIDENAILTVENQVSDAISKGATLECGGKRIADETGYYYEPTLISKVTDDMLCMNEETFGPLAPITTFKTEDEVIKRANNTPYGLAAYLFTKDISQAVRMSEQLEYGIVGLNDGLPSTAQAPFGGIKESGMGREGGHHGIEEYLEIKYLSLGI
ncbi:NAD-dependent succinate-semialdehyde dehydrogenase [Bacillus sp. FJAT-45350]|uniref:NAD-dependent succinate-semialdehyde dehydrogenase n=1 Tax=Bacillus sp. FJAT-45350 TaxID=2011014 RepID=UPI000BB98B23|nr:NAD-dependent succinate-semialdehyde dehydrogenase [Bacillus sp. FJAT-45350]